MKKMNLPEGYVVRCEPHLAILYSGGVEIAMFSAEGATVESIEADAWKHYREKEIIKEVINHG